MSTFSNLMTEMKADPTLLSQLATMISNLQITPSRYDPALTSLQNYRNWHRYCDRENFARAERDAKFLKFVSALSDAAHRAELAEWRTYHLKLLTEYGTSTGDAALLELSLDAAHAAQSPCHPDVMTWVDLHKKATRPSKNAPGRTKSRRSRRPHGSSPTETPQTPPSSKSIAVGQTPRVTTRSKKP